MHTGVVAGSAAPEHAPDRAWPATHADAVMHVPHVRSDVSVGAASWYCSDVQLLTALHAVAPACEEHS